MAWRSDKQRAAAISERRRETYQTLLRQNHMLLKMSAIVTGGAHMVVA